MKMSIATRLAAAAIAVAVTLSLWSAAIRPGAASESEIPSFAGNDGWINSPPLGPKDLRGKIVLVDFWEYTCVNCLRTLPYLREWYKRYRDDGFVIVGVHTPEFDFSGDSHNVAAAAQRLDVTWPIVLDKNYAIWNRYENDEWPHEFLFDRDGTLVDSVKGEGLYPQTELNIQVIIRKSAPTAQLPPVMGLLPQDSYVKPGAVCYPKTAEILLDRARVADATKVNSGSQDTAYDDSGQSHADGSIYLQGLWKVMPEAAVSGSGDGYAALRYHAIQVVSVMKLESGNAVRVGVTQDGHPVPHVDAGSDIRYDEHGASYVTVDAPRAYDLIVNARYGQHELRLEPGGDGVGIYSFAFESCESGSDTK
jgi:thiol-disulfide isomerase/thioredoxin